jgi:SAM-dependent methyltransferase
MLPKALLHLPHLGGDASCLRGADHGCGHLRHYETLARIASELFLVDTEEQLTRVHVDGDASFTVRDFVSSHSKPRGPAVVATNAETFASTRLGLDLVVSVAVLDVVPPMDREKIIRAISRNLRKGGLFLLIVPRNDHSILVRCTDENKYYDGHVFQHHGIETFYCNHRSEAPLMRLCERYRLSAVLDLSRYRQLCIWFRR